MQLAFFDIDGTLSYPAYDTVGEGILYPGVYRKNWKDFCENRRESAYADCEPVMPVKRYAIKRKNEGAKLFVLSASYTEGEDVAKQVFIDKHYKGIFDEVITVRNSGDKIKVIKEYAKKYGVDDSNCELVEDTYELIIDALEAGMIATHVSKLVKDL